MTKPKIPKDHPRAESLHVREELIEQYLKGIVAASGLIAHGRGEAFDYLIGEKTSKSAQEAILAAAAMLLSAKNPVISVNGNTAALVAEDVVKLAQVTGSGIEINLFYRSFKRERAIEKLLDKAGATRVFGVGKNASARIPELSSARRRVDPQGILMADVVMVPLEDGDRTQALVKMGKKVIAIDLNPLSRTARKASITIVDNIVRCAPKLVEAAEELKKQGIEKCREILNNYNTGKNLAQSITQMRVNLSKLAEKTNAQRGRNM